MAGRAASLFAIASLAAIAFAACSGKMTQAGGLEIIVRTDGLQPGMDFDALAIVVQQESSTGTWARLFGATKLVPSQTVLPTTLSIQAGTSGNQEVLITVTALEGGAPIVQRIAQLQIPTDRVAELFMVLAADCTGKVTACSSGSCQPETGLCGPNRVDPATLRDYTPGDESVDAGTSDFATDAAHDATERIDAPRSDASRPSQDGPADGAVDACATGDCAEACVPNATRCSGNAVETCSPNGAYGPAVACVNSTCAMGMCSGACEAGATQCSGSSAMQSCVAGSWGMPAPCTNQACLGGACSGSCSPGSTQCTSDTQMKTCGTDGQWGSAVACSEACLGAIGVAGGNCGGICVPGQTKCTSNTQMQTCGPDGEWSDSACASGETCANGACATIASCGPAGPGMTHCGAASDSCCASLEVAGGTFFRKYTNSGTGPTGEADSATVSGFRLDKYLVTVGRFRQFVSAWNAGAGYLPPAGSGKHTHLNGGRGLASVGGDAGLQYEPGWVASDNSEIVPTNTNLGCPGSAAYATWTPSVGNNENLPINCINWWEAYAFCIWDGGFLPSQSEWEYAAAAGSQQREYPWGTTPPGTGNQYAIYGCYYPSGSGTCASAANIAPVGTASLGAGLWGQLDLEGELFQWNLDGFGTTFVDPCADCANLADGSHRTLQGGNFANAPSMFSPPYYGGDTPTDRYDDNGIRCARTP